MSLLDKLDVWVARHPKIPKIVGAILKKLIGIRDQKIYLESAQMTLSALGMCFTFRSLIGVNPAVKYWDICDNAERFWEDSFKHDVEIDATIRGLASLIEPLLIVVIGVIVGIIVISLYLPIFNLVNIIK